jgi:sperm-associated antigen 16 protein
MHHQRVQQEKKKLNYDLEKLRNNHIVFEKRYDEMADKYSRLMKEKMLIKLERDRLKTRAQIQKEINQNSPGSVSSEPANASPDKLSKTK